MNDYNNRSGGDRGERRFGGGGRNGTSLVTTTISLKGTAEINCSVATPKPLASIISDFLFALTDFRRRGMCVFFFIFVVFASIMDLWIKYITHALIYTRTVPIIRTVLVSFYGSISTLFKANLDHIVIPILGVLPYKIAELIIRLAIDKHLHTARFSRNRGNFIRRRT